MKLFSMTFSFQLLKLTCTFALILECDMHAPVSTYTLHIYEPSLTSLV